MTTIASNVDSDLQALLRDTGVGLWSYEGAHHRFTIDAVCRELFDLAPDEPLHYERLKQVIHPEDLPAYWAAIQAAMAGSGEFDVQYRMLRRDGAVRFISSRGRVRPHMPGEPIVVNGICIDVTERQQLVEQLHATELQMKTLADSFPGLFCYVDRHFIVRFLSNRYVEHLGAPRADLVGRHLSELTGPQRFAERRALYESALRGVSHSLEDPRVLPNGEMRYYAITYHPDRSVAGDVRGFMAIGLDITELRRVEQELQQRTRELSRSNHDLEQFAYVASHDLKAPLRAIEVLVGWLRDDLAGYQCGEVQENLALLGQRATRLHRLLDDLLAYSRAGRAGGEPVRVDSRQLVQDVAVLLAPPAGMTVEADASLPELVTWHAPLEQVIRNLVNNAIKHHPTKQGTVRVYAETRDGELAFAVEDDGAGIPAEFSEKVFQMFQTLKPRDEVEGSGMGLAIVKRIVEGQGGRVWFRPGRGGRGTVFKFTWKRLPEAAARAAGCDGNGERRHLAG
jgi:PAS domain S-box-containing protein